MALNIVDLPNVVLIEIFEYLSYEEVAKCRMVSRKIDEICQVVLNCGFNKIVRLHAASFKRIKAMLPRRESERRNHCFARHADILTSIETRISMLSMTYCKYIDLNVCCFIPGRVLDEIRRILHLVAITQKPLRPHEVLQELRDISSMAIEHFDEKIAHTLKKNYTETFQQYNRNGFSSPPASQNLWFSTSSSNSSHRCCESIRQKVNTLLNCGHITLPDEQNKPGPIVLKGDAITNAEDMQGCPEARAALGFIKKFDVEYKKGCNKVTRLRNDLAFQTRRLTQAYNAISELKSQMVELKKRIEEVEAKNKDLSDNVKHLKSGETPVESEVAKTHDVKLSPIPVPFQPLVSQSQTNQSPAKRSCVNEPLKLTLKRSTRKRKSAPSEMTSSASSTCNASVVPLKKTSE